MLKKYTAILLLSAYALLLGHNIIPHHHHHDNEHTSAENHHTTHHHDSDDSEGLNHLFSYFIHSSDGFIVTPNQTISNTAFPLLAILPDCYFADDFDIPPLLHFKYTEPHIYISPHSLSSGLRAPPVSIS